MAAVYTADRVSPNRLKVDRVDCNSMGFLLVWEGFLSHFSENHMPAISLSSSYSQNFDSLLNTGTANSWVNDSTISGWYSNRTTYLAGTGSSNTGGLYSFGASSSSDRALGSLASGGTGNIFAGARFVNDTGSTISALNISYIGEQWRAGGPTTPTNTTVPNTLDFQYKIGAISITETGWIDFNALDFTSPISPGTAGALDGNAAANRVVLSSSLSGLSLLPGQEIWLRWQDINDAGNDHGLAIDDFSITAAASPAALSFTVAPSSFSEAAGANAALGTITRTGSTATALTINLSSSDTTEATAPGSVVIGAGESSVSFAIAAVDDTIIDGDQSVILTATASGFTNATASITVTDNEVAPSPITKIHQIQGSGNTFDPLFSGIRTIEAVVVGDFQTSGSVANLRGFFVQEEDFDVDLSALTSEGLFVFDDSFGVNVNVGDLVRVTGSVAEFSSGSSSSLTQLRSITNVTILGANNPLPSAVVLNFPVNSTTDLEAFEGMRVTIPEALTVTEHFQLGRFGQVVLSSEGATNQAGTDNRLEQYTQFNAPSVSGYANYLSEIAKRRIVLDDAQTIQNPDPIIHARGGQPLSATNTLRGGDTVTGLTGILDDRFGDANVGNYRIQTQTPVNFQPTNPRPTTVPDVGGSIKVASFNVLNFFNGNGQGGGFPTSRGANTAVEFDRQTDKLVPAILGLNADVIGLIELENDGYGPNSAIQTLINELNAVAGAGTFAFINPGLPALGTDEIAVGFVYKPGKVTPVGVAATVPDGFGQGAFNGDNRKPLAQTFEDNETFGQFTAVINHFKSKGSSAGNPGDADANDGQGLSNGTRTRASQDLAAWLATNPTGVNDSDVMILGDLNAYAQEDPIVALETAGYTNLVSDTSYSFVFNGQWGSLDHALANGSLVSQVTGAAKWHINADEPNVLDYNTEFKSPGQVNSLYAANPFRSSDHDPVVVGLNLTINTIVGTAGDDIRTGTAGNDRMEGGNGRDSLNGGAGNDILVGGLGADRLTGGAGRDRFVYNSINESSDRIADFEIGIDQIDLRGLFNELGYTGSNPIADGFLRLVAVGNTTQIQIDADGANGSNAFGLLAIVQNTNLLATSNFATVSNSFLIQ
jgi:predicted extracellular nuclease